MQEKTVEKDINDVFNDIVFSEEHMLEQSYAEGYAKGVLDGNPEGYHLGYHRGAELGAELGFYYAVIEKQLQQKQAEKVRNLLMKIRAAIEQFPRENLADFDIIGEVDNIRTNYKKICAMLKLDMAHPEIDNLSF